MKLLSLLAGFALFATGALANQTSTQTQQAEFVAEVEEVALDGSTVQAKVFEFKAAAVGTCTFGRETIKVYRDGDYSDRVRYNGECLYVRGYPLCELTATLTVTDMYEERLKRWDWQRTYDWEDEDGGRPVKIQKNSKNLEKNYRDITYVFREMKCDRLRD